MREPEPYDHLFKLLLIGDAGVGKSRYVEGAGAEGRRHGLAHVERRGVGRV